MATLACLTALLLTIWSSWTNAEVTQTMDQVIMNAASEIRDVGLLWDDSSVLVESDMRFTHEQWREIQKLRKDYATSRSKRKAYRPTVTRWDRGVIPYKFSEGFNEKGKAVIREAMAEWQRVSCVSFQEASGREPSINFLPTGGCSSNVGKTGRPGQTLTLGNGCLYKGVVVHELGHALGFFHEQSRPDRDNYVRIHKENIINNMEYNFKKQTPTVINTYDIPYDLKSIMHYGPYYFSKNGQRTISAVNEADTKLIGNRHHLTFNDIHLANKMYQCSASCRSTSCPRNAFLGKNCRCWCKGSKDKEPVIDCETKRPIEVSTGVKPTVKPTTPTPTGTLVDHDTGCPDWAAAGFCDHDPYTIEYCKKSCSLYATPKPTTPSGDRHPHCPYWAQYGECQRNPGYMLVYCKASCARLVPKCKDTMPRMCSIFSNECRSRTLGQIMRKFCSKTCDSCTLEQTLASCQDLAPLTCRLYAAAGRCHSKNETVLKSMQMSCPKTCGHCRPNTDPNSSNRGRAGRVVDPSCYDRFRYCPKWARNNGCSSPFLRSTMQIFCRRSCNLCR